jgi:hypothetical protein
MATKYQKSPKLAPGFLYVAKQRVKALSGLVTVYYTSLYVIFIHVIFVGIRPARHAARRLVSFKV